MKHSTIKTTRNMLSFAKKIICSTASLMIMATMTQPISTKAESPFIVQLSDHSGIQINGSFMTSAVTMPSNKEYIHDLMNINNKFEPGIDIYAAPGTQMILKFTIKNATEQSIKDLKISVTSYSRKKGRYEARTVSQSNQPEKKTTSTGTDYTVTFKFENFGDYFYFKSANAVVPYDSSKYVRCTDIHLTDNPEFVAVQTMAPNGYDSFIASVPYINGVSKDVYRSWSENMCTFINSLSDMTGIKKDIVFYESYGSASCDNNSLDLSYYKSYPIASIESSGTKTLISYLSNWNYKSPVINQEELHELAHAYGIRYTDCDPNQACPAGYSSNCTGRQSDGKYYRRNDFTNYYNMNADDIFTNARGIAAIQHCSALRNVTIATTAIKGSADAVTGTYADFTQKEMNHINSKNPNWYNNIKNNPKTNVENDLRAHWFNAVLIDIATKNNNWNGLKEFFRGTAPNSASMSNVYSTFGSYLGVNYSGINLDLCKSLSYSPAINESKVKLANTTYKLYSIFNSQSTTFNGDNYKQFLNKYFGDNNLTGKNVTGNYILKSLVQN